MYKRRKVKIRREEAVVVREEMLEKYMGKILECGAQGFFARNLSQELMIKTTAHLTHINEVYTTITK